MNADDVDRAIAELERALAGRRPVRLPDHFASLSREERQSILLDGVR